MISSDFETDPLKHEVTIREDLSIDDAINWCKEQFGPQRSKFYGLLPPHEDGTWRRVQTDRFRGVFFFAKVDDAFAFKLRWA